MATIVTPSLSGQATSRRRPAVVVGKGRTSGSTAPGGRIRRRPARIVARWTSRPAQQWWMTSKQVPIARPPPTRATKRPPGVATGRSTCSPVLGGDRSGYGNEVGARLVHGLGGTEHTSGLVIALGSVSRG